MALRPALRVTETRAIAYRSTWRGTIVSSFLRLVLFLAAMGMGLGTLVDRGGGRALGVPYLDFLAPGLLAATAMMVGSMEAMWPVMAGFKWIRSYDAMLATPISPADVAVGQLLWIAVRLVIACGAYVVVTSAFGALRPLAILVVLPAAVLTGMAYAAPVAAFTASLQLETALATLQRFAILPMFLLSGTFFPVEQLPAALRAVAYVTPIWHGVDLCRSVALGTAGAGTVAGHLAYLAACLGLGAALAVRQFRRRLLV